MDGFLVQPIGVVRSNLRARDAAPNQAPAAPLEIDRRTPMRCTASAALEAVDATPIVDLKLAMRDA